MNRYSKENINREMATCVHWRGMMGKTCAAGIEFPRPIIPVCLLRVKGATGIPDEETLTALREACPCPSAKFLTESEARDAITEREKRTNEFVEKMNIARTAIMADVGDRLKQGVSGTIPCPVCKTGQLRYSRAGNYNGHVHAACTTQGCVMWME